MGLCWCVSENIYFWWTQVCGENVHALFCACFSEFFVFMWLYTLLRGAKLPGCIQTAGIHVLHPVCLSGGRLYLSRISPVPLHCSQPWLCWIADTGSQQGRVSGFSLTGHISACSSLTTDSTHCPSLRAAQLLYSELHAWLVCLEETDSLTQHRHCYCCCLCDVHEERAAGIMNKVRVYWVIPRFCQ